jgi:large-conductance mechanosensitive channel
MSATNITSDIISSTTDSIGDVATNIGSTFQEGATSFGNLMKDFNVIGFVLGLLMSNSVSEIANNLIDSIIMPSIKPFLDRVSRENDTIVIGSVTLHLEKLVNALMKFIVLAIVIFLFVSFGVTVTKPVTWVKVVGVSDGVKI